MGGKSNLCSGMEGSREWCGKKGLRREEDTLTLRFRARLFIYRFIRTTVSRPVFCEIAARKGPRKCWLAQCDTVQLPRC